MSRILLFICSVLLLIHTHASAQDLELPTGLQTVMRTHFVFEPMSLPGVPFKKVEIHTPVLALIDKNNRLWGIQIGEDTIRILITHHNNELETVSLPYATVPLSWAKKTDFKAVVRVLILGEVEAIYVDGRDLNPGTGGTLKIRYVSKPIFHTSHDFNIKFKSEKGRWFAYTDEDRAFSDATVEAGFFGLGLASPEYLELDPSKLIEDAMQTKGLTLSGAEYSERVEAGKNHLKTFIKSPTPLAAGLTLEVKTSAELAD